MIEIRPALPDDRERIYALLLHSELFGKHEADTVDEMFTQAINKPGPDQYRFMTAWMDKHLCGFACFGWESMTTGCWDLFWICTRPEARGKGVGGALLRNALETAQKEHGRLMVIYTSSTDAYAPARKLYASQGFVLTAVIPNYYNIDDDLNIFSHKLQG